MPFLILTTLWIFAVTRPSDTVRGNFPSFADFMFFLREPLVRSGMRQEAWTPAKTLEKMAWAVRCRKVAAGFISLFI